MDLRKTRIKAQITLVRDQLQELERLINLEPESATIEKTEQRPDRPLLMSVSETTKMLGAIGRGKVYELIRDGSIKSIKVGSRRLVVTGSLHEFIERLTMENEDPEMN